jgi:hypothetical protein
METWFYAYLAHITYFFLLASYLTRKMSWLRVCAIMASVVTVFYAANVGSEPLWIPIFWNLAFIAVNGSQLAFQHWQGRLGRFTPTEHFLSKTVLQNFPPAEVKSFTEIARPGLLDQGNYLVQEGTELAYLFCLLKGKVDVVAQHRKVTELTAGHFVGEMSLLTQSAARANVVAVTDLELICWDHHAIEAWVNSDATRLGLLQAALGTQVVNQLLQQNSDLMDQQANRNAG